MGRFSASDPDPMHLDEHNVVAAGRVNVKDPIYGAAGDGATDDTAAVQAAIDAAETMATGGYANGGTVWFPPGNYRVTSLTVDEPDVHLAGPGQRSATLSTVTGDLLKLGTASTGVSNGSVTGLTLMSGAGGGNIVDVRHSMSGWLFRDVLFNQDNDDKSAIRKANNEDANDNLWDNCRWEHTLTATVPTIDMPGNLVSANEWRHQTVLYTGNYWLKLDPQTAGSYHWGNRVRGLFAEVTTGGMVYMAGARNPLIEDVTVFDLQNDGPLLRDGIVLATSTGGQRGFGGKIARVDRAGGSLDTGIVDVDVSGHQEVTLEHLRGSPGEFAVNLGGHPGHVLIGPCGNTITGAAEPIRLDLPESITGTTDSEKVTSIIAALAALGLATDDTT